MKHVREDRWITSDGWTFFEYQPAADHERYLTVLARLQELRPLCLSDEAFARELLASPGFRIIRTPT